VKDQVGALWVVDVVSRRDRGVRCTQRTQRGLILFAVIPLRALREKLLVSQRAQSEMHAENAEKSDTLCGNSFAGFA